MNPTRRKALGAALVVAGALAAVPSGASASTQACNGHWGTAPKDATAELTTKFGVQYVFACSQNIHGFAVVTSRSLDAFSTEAATFRAADHAPGLLLGCEGPIPGLGASCFGANATDKALAGYTVVGRVGTDVSPCGWDAESQSPFRASIVVTDNAGNISGPFQLKPPKGCAAKYAKAAKAAKARKKRNAGS